MPLRIVLAFLVTWITYWTSLALFPYKSRFAPGQPLNAWEVEIVFVIFVLIATLSGWFLSGRKRTQPLGLLDAPEWKWMVLVGATLAFSLIAIFYDRVFIQGVDYSKGFAYAREDWRTKSNERLGISSLYSALGNLIFPGVHLFVIWVGVSAGRWTMKFAALLYAAALVLAFSIMTGGREALFVYAISLSYVAMRNLDFRNPKQLVTICLAGVMGVLAFGTIAAKFFDARIAASDATHSTYIYFMLLRLGANPSRTLCEPEVAEALCQIKLKILPIVAYLIHSHWLLDHAIEIKSTPQYAPGATYATLGYILKKLRLVESDAFPPWSLSSLFVSQPGGLYFDFGLLGLLAGATIFGMVFWFALFVRSRRKELRVPGEFILFALFAFLISSPVVPLQSFVPFFYVICLIPLFGLASLFVIKLGDFRPPSETSRDS